MFLGESQCYPGVDAEEDDQQGLHRVHDEHEIECIVRLDAVEDKHRLHGEMPRSGSVGGRDDDGDAAHDESYQSAHQTQVRGRLEALEREIVVQKIAQPYSYGEGDEERNVLDPLE